MAALCIPAAFAGAEPDTVLPAGSALTFVSDAVINAASVHAGYRYRAHLQADLTLGSTLLAPAGTRVDLVVAEVVRDTGPPRMRLEFGGLKIAGAGELPVVPAVALVDLLTTGTPIAAQTGGSVELLTDRTLIRVPLPYALSSNVPRAMFTAQPYRTAAPIVPPSRAPRPGTSADTPAPSPTPVDSTPPELQKPAVSPIPTTTPS